MWSRLMLKPWQFKLGSRCDTSKKISHMDKYPEFEGKRFMMSGRSTRVFKSYIQRKFAWNAASLLFKEYITWYKLTTGSHKGIWKSWKDLCHTDFDLTHGYLWYEFLIQVPVIEELFDNRKSNNIYISSLRLAIYYDLIRFGRFSTVEDVYKLDGGTIFELTKNHFRKYMNSVYKKCMDGGAMSYENFRVMKWLSTIYQWKKATLLINDKKIRSRSKSKLVRGSNKETIKKFKMKVNKIAEGYRLINKILPIDVDDEAVTDRIWDLYYKGVDDA